MNYKEYLESIVGCEFCKHSFYDKNDIKEEEKCNIIGRYSQFPVNEDIKFLIDKYNLKNICEYFDMRISRKN
jgi:hypothetical protein